MSIGQRVGDRIGREIAVAIPLTSAPMGGGADPGLAVLAEARIYVDWSDAANHGGKYAINRNDARTVTPNLLAFPTGPIVNESGGATPTRTNNYANGPDGATLTAARLESTGTNQVHYLCRPSLITPTLPNGTYSIRFRARSNTGKGDQTLNIGLSSSYLSVTCKELDWSNPANLAATTFEREFTFSGTGDPAIRLPSSGEDIIIDHLQFHDGPLSTMPAYSPHVPAGGRKGFSFTDSLVLDANDLVDTTGQTSGMLVFDPDFPAAHTYSAYTTMVVCSLNATPGATAHIANTHPGDGGTTTANVISAEGTPPYSGEINASATSSSRSSMAANLSGYGLFIAGQGRDATTRKVYIDTVPAYIESRAFAGVNASRFTVGGFTTSNVADLRGNLSTGKHAYYVRWDRLLTDTEWKDAANALRGLLSGRGISLAPLTDYHVISGDSNSTRANNDWTQLVTAKDYLTPQRNLVASITSVGGQGIDDIERDKSGAESGLADGTITANGRFGVRDLPALLGGVEDGRYSLYHLPIGTNDWDLLDAYSGDNTAKATAYVARVQALIAHALSFHERIHVMWYSLLPQTSTSRPNWETQRLEVNSQMAAWIATQDRVHLCDFGGSATIGDRSLQAGGGGTYYLSDEIHFSSAGDIEAADIAGDAVKAWRSGLGIDA